MPADIDLWTRWIAVDDTKATVRGDDASLVDDRYVAALSRLILLLWAGARSGLLSWGTPLVIIAVGLSVCPASLRFDRLIVKVEDAEVAIKYCESRSLNIDTFDGLPLLDWARGAILGVVLVYGITPLTVLPILLSRWLVIIAAGRLWIQRLAISLGIRR